jgi:BMFP domain-containing protein YqiC
VQVRVAQQTIANSFLKSLDLPTRAELNSVHKRLKEMRERIEQLEQVSLEDKTGDTKTGADRK